jgi:O-antigen ligase
MGQINDMLRNIDILNDNPTLVFLIFGVIILLIMGSNNCSGFFDQNNSLIWIILIVGVLFLLNNNNCYDGCDCC